jgi:hypothetical protein
MLPVRGLSRISRIVNLSFKISGIKEESAAIQALTSGIQNFIQLTIRAMMAYRGLQMMMAGSPWGAAMLAVVGLSTISGIQGSSSNELEEYRSRSAK